MDNRINNFDAVRLLAALAVIYGHAFPLALLGSPVLYGNSVQAFAVKIFFTVSGYLICKSWVATPTFLGYFAKRCLRIFPGLICLVLFTALIVGPVMSNLSIGEYIRNATTLGYLKNILLYPVYNLVDLFDKNLYKSAVNGSLWSLPVEFFMYMAIAFLAMKGIGRSPVLWVATLVLAVFSIYFVHYNQPLLHAVFYGTDLISALDVMPYFLIGAIYSYYSLDKFLNLGVAMFLVGFMALFQPGSAVQQEIYLYFFAPYIILSFATASTPFVNRIGKYGDFSYGIYLYGFLIQQILNAVTDNSLSPYENAFLSMPIALLCACASWNFIEKPALKYKVGLNQFFKGGRRYE